MKWKKIEATTKVITEEKYVQKIRDGEKKGKNKTKKTENIKPDGNIVNKSIKKKCCRFYFC